VSCGDLSEVAAQGEHTARQAGWASPSAIHAVGDGAEWIARLAKQCFGTRGYFHLDLFHVSEYPAAAPVCAAHRYMDNRRDQLDYPRALSRDLPLGSGLIESGHRHVLQHRLKIAGEAWLRANSEAITHARAVRANGGWPAYWTELARTRN